MFPSINQSSTPLITNKINSGMTIEAKPQKPNINLKVNTQLQQSNSTIKVNTSQSNVISTNSNSPDLQKDKLSNELLQPLSPEIHSPNLKNRKKGNNLEEGKQSIKQSSDSSGYNSPIIQNLTQNNEKKFNFMLKSCNNIDYVEEDHLDQMSEKDEDLLEPQYHHIWDNDDLKIRGIDIDRWLDKRGQPFNFLNLYQYRYETYPTDSKSIENEKVVRIVQKFCQNRQTKAFTQQMLEEFQDYNDYSDQTHLKTDLNFSYFVNYYNAYQNSEIKKKRTLQKRLHDQNYLAKSLILNPSHFQNGSFSIFGSEKHITINKNIKISQGIKSDILTKPKGGADEKSHYQSKETSPTLGPEYIQITSNKLTSSMSPNIKNIQKDNFEDIKNQFQVQSTQNNGNSMNFRNSMYSNKKTSQHQHTDSSSNIDSETNPANRNQISQSTVMDGQRGESMDIDSNRMQGLVVGISQQQKQASKFQSPVSFRENGGLTIQSINRNMSSGTQAESGVTISNSASPGSQLLSGSIYSGINNNTNTGSIITGSNVQAPVAYQKQRGSVSKTNSPNVNTNILNAVHPNVSSAKSGLMIDFSNNFQLENQTNGSKSQYEEKKNFLIRDNFSTLSQHQTVSNSNNTIAPKIISQFDI